MPIFDRIDKIIRIFDFGFTDAVVKVGECVIIARGQRRHWAAATGGGRSGGQPGRAGAGRRLKGK